MILKPFAYHAPSEEGLRRITRLREAYSNLLDVIQEEAHPSREKSIAITELETSAMWAVKAVVYNDPMSTVAE